MASEERKCSECSGRMVPGQLIDQSNLTSGPQHWAMKATGIMGIGIVDSYPIVSFRCEKCGFLKNYAIKDPVDPEVEEAVKVFEDKRETDPIMM